VTHRYTGCTLFTYLCI